MTLITSFDDPVVDLTPRELARFCPHALTAASELSSKAAVRRLVDVTASALRAGS